MRPMAPPTVADFQRYGVNALGVTDIIEQPLFDHLSYPAAGTQSLIFFSQGKGQGVTSHPGAAGAKTIADTNVKLNGQLDAPNGFLAMGVQLTVYPGVNPAEGAPITAAQVGRFLNDVWAIFRSGSLRFTVGEKDQIVNAPVGKFPSQHFIAVDAAISESLVAAADTRSQINAARFAGPVHRITPAGIPSGQNFSVALEWPALVVLPSGQPARIGCDILGWLARKAQ